MKSFQVSPLIVIAAKLATTASATAPQDEYNDKQPQQSLRRPITTTRILEEETIVPTENITEELSLLLDDLDNLTAEMATMTDDDYNVSTAVMTMADDSSSSSSSSSKSMKKGGKGYYSSYYATKKGKSSYYSSYYATKKGKNSGSHSSSSSSRSDDMDDAEAAVFGMMSGNGTLMDAVTNGTLTLDDFVNDTTLIELVDDDNLLSMLELEEEDNNNSEDGSAGETASFRSSSVIGGSVFLPVPLRKLAEEDDNEKSPIDDGSLIQQLKRRFLN